MGRPRTMIYTGDGVGLTLPAASVVEGQPVPGGLRTTHELAFAIAATGRSVELRGPVDRATYDRLAGATSAGPELPSSPSRPRPGDVVIVTEGDPDPLCAGRVLLS